MLFCENCGAQNADTVTFCDKCGQSLAASQNRTVPPVQLGQRARLSLPAKGKIFDLGDKATITIGREDPVSGYSPDVDLTPFGGDAAAVGRRHAQLIFTENGWRIQDCASWSGVFVNKRKTPPFNEMVPLKSGDRIRLGRLELVFETY